ncbi:MAG: YraN family protein [Firmicutes bacterium]|nr:YraN family protein [Bacillota bacterium]
MSNQVKGKSGEKTAEKFLKKKGCKVLHRNYKTNLGEIDLIVFDKDTLVFVEVKSRSGTLFGTPAEAVTHFKRTKINQVAAQFLTRQSMRDVPVRFDVVEVYLNEGRVEHIENAFDSYLRY